MNPPAADAGGAGALRVYFGGQAPVTFTAPSAGVYRFYLWGGGGAFTTLDYRPAGAVQIPSGGTGALSRYDRRMAKGETAAIFAGGPGVASTVTFADGHVVSAGAGGAGFDGGSPNAGTGGLGGVAIGGDININGEQGGGYTGNPRSGGGTDGGSPGANVVSGPNTYWGGSGAPGIDGLRGGNGGTASGVGATTPGGGGAYDRAAGAGVIIVTQRS